jgi:predicted amidohydrolase YtcJ
MPGDVVVLSDDITTATPEARLRTQVDYTIVDGSVRYARARHGRERPVD